MTDDEKEKWLEGAEEFGDAIENRSLVPVMAEGEIDNTVSFPAVKYDKDPTEYSSAKPEGYRQVYFKTFYNKITDLADEVSEATSGLTTLKEQTQAAADAATAAAGSVDQAIENAEAATAYAERVNATMDGMEITVTDRNGVSVTKNIGFDMVGTYASVALMNADAANVEEGKFVIIATQDPTSADNAKLYVRNSNAATSANPFSFCADLDQASAAAWADWLDNMKPQIEAAITQAGTDHTTAVSDHTQAATDHSTATSDHTTATTDHTTAQSDSTKAGTDHSTAVQDHSYAATDHSTASNDHTQALADTNRAGQDHSTAASDHTTASADHTAAVTATNAANDAAALANTKAQYAEAQGDIAKDWNDHQPFIGDGISGDPNYWYIWFNGAYVKSVYAKGDDLHWDEMSQQEKDDLAARVLAQLTFASVQTCEDIIDELT